MQDKLAQNTLQVSGIYQDADLTLQAHPAEISHAMVEKVSANLRKITWSDALVAEFLGSYLSEPAADLVFEPNKKINARTFAEKLAKHGLCLDLKSQMLFNASTFFMNGEQAEFTGEAAAILMQLANNRALAACSINDAALLQQLLDWYVAGYLQLQGK